MLSRVGVISVSGTAAKEGRNRFLSGKKVQKYTFNSTFLYQNLHPSIEQSGECNVEPGGCNFSGEGTPAKEGRQRPGDSFHCLRHVGNKFAMKCIPLVLKGHPQRPFDQIKVICLQFQRS